MQLAEPAWLIAALTILPWLIVAERRRPRLAWPTLAGFAEAPWAKAGILRLLPPLVRMAAIIAVGLALARPRTVGGVERIATRGVAIVVALDHSSSMNARDFPGPNGTQSRLDAAKATLATFVEGRPDDLIGLVVFANFADVLCPPTLQHDVLIDTTRNLRSARPGEDGTNLGDAMAVAIDSLRKTNARRKVLVLLTDGINDPAVEKPFDPIEAARVARALGVTVHTIAVGGRPRMSGLTDATTRLNVPEESAGPDVELLTRIAEEGGGRAFQAAGAADLAGVFSAIDALEKSHVEARVTTRYREWYPYAAGAALALILVEILLRAGPLRRLP